jgi:hypothetical protein
MPQGRGRAQQRIKKHETYSLFTVSGTERRGCLKI